MRMNREMIKRVSMAPAAGLLVGLVLTACGGEREEPFDPGEPDEEEVRDPVNSRLLTSGSFSDEFGSYPATTGHGRRLLIIDNIDDYADVMSEYETQFVSEPDFEEGQVFLYDSGWVDDSGCTQQVLLDRVQAYSITDDDTVGEIELTYDRRRVRDGDVCDGEIPYREYEVHYIESQADLLMVETIPNVNDGLGSSSASSSLFSSSSSSQSSSMSSLSSSSISSSSDSGAF